MLSWVKFIGFALILNVALWYLCDLLLWIEFRMKPYTAWGMAMTTWIEHGVFISLAMLYSMVLAWVKE